MVISFHCLQLLILILLFSCPHNTYVSSESNSSHNNKPLTYEHLRSETLNRWGIVNKNASFGIQDLDEETKHLLQTMLVQLSYPTYANAIYFKQLNATFEVGVAAAYALPIPKSTQKIPFVLISQTFKSLPPDEQYFVLAHELAHLILHHTEKREYVLNNLKKMRMVIGILSLIPYIYYANKHYRQSSWGEICKNELKLFGITLVPALVLNSLLSRWYKSHEFEADTYAIKSIGSIDGGISFLKRMHTKEKTILPTIFHRVLYQLFGTHPRTSDRVKNLLKITHKN